MFNADNRGARMMQSLQVKPYSLESSEGKKFETPTADIVVKAGTQQTGGSFNLFEVKAMAGFATSLHIHYAEDVALFVLDGSLTVYWGDEKKAAEPGDYFFQPRGLPQGFRVTGDAPARLLYLAVPAGLDGLIDQVLSAACDVECMAIAARYQVEILGPLPG